MKQIEIELPENSINVAINCSCMKETDRVLVIMQKGIDPSYLIGKCHRCNKRYISRIKGAT